MANDDSDIMTPAELGNKLVVALRSVSDPQAIMQAIADRTAINLRTELNTRIEAMDKAVVLWHEDLVRVPTEVQKAVTALREFLEGGILMILWFFSWAVQTWGPGAYPWAVHSGNLLFFCLLFLLGWHAFGFVIHN